MVTGDATYSAVFADTENEYKITFVNEDGTVLQTTNVLFGIVPTYNGATPVKAETDKYTYEFSGWTPEITAVTGDATYTAVFKATEKPAQNPGTYFLKSITGTGKDSDIVITIGRTEDDANTINYLDTIKSDDKILTPGQECEVGSGSVVITLKKSYLDTLSAGTHTLEVTFNDGGSIKLEYTVEHAAPKKTTNKPTDKNTSIPSTGEQVAKTVFIGSSCVLLACAVAGGVIVIKRRRKGET